MRRAEPRYKQHPCWRAWAAAPGNLQACERTEGTDSCEAKVRRYACGTWPAILECEGVELRRPGVEAFQNDDDETTSRFEVGVKAWCAGCNSHYTAMQGTQ